MSEHLEILPEIRALNTSFATVTLDPDGRIRTTNNRFLDLFRYDLSELVGQNEGVYILARTDDMSVDALLSALEDGKICHIKSLCKTRTGEEIWLASTYVPVFEDGDGLASVIHFGRDITGERQAGIEDRGYVAAFSDAYAVTQFSLDGTVLNANEHAAEMLGYDPADLVGKAYSDLVDKDVHDDDEYARFWQKVVRGKKQAIEVLRRRADAGGVWMQCTYSLIRDEVGRPAKVIECAIDTTDSKLRNFDYEWQIRAINHSHAVITFDLHGGILDANQNFLDVMGYSIDEIRGQHHRIFVERHLAHSAAYANFWRDLRKGSHRSGEYKRLAKDGSDVWLSATYNPIFDAAGNVVKIVKFANVVTEEKLRQAEYQGQISAIDRAQCIISFDLDGNILDANENFLRTAGYRFSEVRGQHHRMFVTPETAASDEYRDFWERLGEGTFESGEYKRIGKDGREFWLQATYNPIYDMDGEPFKVVKYAIDVTQEKNLRADFQSQIEAIHRSQGVVTFSLDGRVEEINDGMLSMLGYERDDLIGKHHRMLVGPELRDSTEYETFWNTLRSGQFHSGRYRRIRKDGSAVWIQATYNPILDTDGDPIKVIKFATDVTSDVKMAEAFEDARKQAQHDIATSLPNRAKLTAFMAEHLANPKESLAVFYVDLDRFKPVNDLFGHSVGDKVLAEVADRLRRLLRGDQMVARVGGDEFVIAAPNLPQEGVSRLCRNILAITDEPFQHLENQINIGVSIGVALAPGDGNSPDELLRNADTALFRSKSDGRGTYTFFESEMNQKMVAERETAEQMRRGLEKGEFFLNFQPRYCTKTQEIRSFEALVRWAHPERGVVGPGEFIPIAERTGQIVSLGKWIMEAACTAATKWEGIGVSVNVSPVQFKDDNLVEVVQSILGETGLRPGLLELEITEGVLIDDGARALRMLQELKATGITLAMDDFGTGYSSLSYLRDYPFDIIKIDRSFIRDVGCSESAKSIVRAIIELSHALGLTSTAEGIETEEHLRLMRQFNCGEIQGFLMSPPVGENEAREMIAAREAAAA